MTTEQLNLIKNRVYNADDFEEFRKSEMEALLEEIDRLINLRKQDIQTINTLNRQLSELLEK